jgi:hypothetical protein
LKSEGRHRPETQLLAHSQNSGVVDGQESGQRFVSNVDSQGDLHKDPGPTEPGILLWDE